MNNSVKFLKELMEKYDMISSAILGENVLAFGYGEQSELEMLENIAAEFFDEYVFVNRLFNKNFKIPVRYKRYHRSSNTDMQIAIFRTIIRKLSYDIQKSKESIMKRKRKALYK